MDRTGGITRVNEISHTQKAAPHVFSLTRTLGRKKKDVKLSRKGQDAEGEGRGMIKSKRCDNVVKVCYTQEC